jgi:S-adenosylmethionine decarboxylase
MIFEGSEKKFELIVSSFNLRSLGIDFFSELVSKANATILQSLSNKHCDAYLLSESSLFVWEDRLLMITCGQTTLKNSLLFLLEKLSKEKVNSIIFQRKNEHFSDMQESTFYQDVKSLKEKIEGTSLRFGTDHEHHNLIFSTKEKLENINEDKTYEILSYDISKEASDFLTKPHLTCTNIRQFLRLDEVLEGFEISDFVFEPFGYSLNALREDDYCTIHITPQSTHSYVSFETNMSCDVSKLTNYLKEVLNPESIDVVCFNLLDKLELPEGYIRRSHYQEILDCGYLVDFFHLYKENIEMKKPVRL